MGETLVSSMFRLPVMWNMHIKEYNDEKQNQYGTARSRRVLCDILNLKHAGTAGLLQSDSISYQINKENGSVWHQTNKCDSNIGLFRINMINPTAFQMQSKHTSGITIFYQSNMTRLHNCLRTRQTNTF